MKSVLCVLISVMLSGVCLGAEFYVSPNGDDKNAGSKQKPFKTLEKARDAARSHRATTDSEKLITVYLAAGAYRRTKPFVLSSADHHITFKAMPSAEVSITGDVDIPLSRVSVVTDAATLERLVPEARGKVLQAGLEGLAIDELAAVGPRGFNRPLIPASNELVLDGRIGSIAQWPNVGKPRIHMGRVIDPGSKPRWDDKSNRGGTFEWKNTDRPLRWRKANDLYLYGYFNNGYADDLNRIAKIDFEKRTFTFATPHLYGLEKRKGDINQYIAFNLLEEIDHPGEYFVDREARTVYFYPASAPTDLRSISLTQLGKPLVQVSDTAAVVFERIAFENSRERGVVMTNSANCEIRACLFRNLGRNAVDITGGSKCGVVSTEVYDTGAGGVNLDGGDRKTLTPSAHYVRNCEFHHFNRIEKTYRPAVAFKGVGQILSHSYIHHSDAGMILFAGNDHLIEYNEFAYGMQHADEMGAIYTGRDPSACGTVIRYNYFHHMGSQLGGHGTECISFDDGSGFCRIYGNVFYKSADGHIGGNGAVGLRIENNVFIRNKRPIKINNWGSGWHEWVRGKGRKKSHNIPDKIFNDTVNILEPPYSTRYPELVEMYHSGPKADRFKSNKIVTNVFVDEPLGKLPDPAKNLALKGDPGFENMAQENFTLKKDSVVFEKLPDFKPIPFEKIGLQKDEYRK